MKYEWEEVLNCATKRLRLPKGWLVRSTNGGMSYNQGASVSIIFIEDINHDWEL